MLFTAISANEPDIARKGYYIKLLIKVMQNSNTAIEKCKVPVIAVVHGFCIGAGVDLLSACDIVVTTDDSQLAIREVKIGMAADLGSLARLPLISKNWSLMNELALTGRFFTPKESQDLGLSHHSLPNLDAALAKARTIARDIAQLSPIAIYGTKSALNLNKAKAAREGLQFIKHHNKSALITDDMAKAVQGIMSKEDVAFPRL